MKFIEISEFESVCVDSIAYFRAVEGGTMLMMNDGTAYPTTLSYEIVKKLIGINDSKYDKMLKSMNVISKSMTRPTP